MSLILIYKFSFQKHIMRNNQSGNIFAFLFGAVALVGVLTAASMQLVTGPLRTMTAITQKNLVESQLHTNARLVVIHAGIQANNGDADSDSFIEPVEYVPSGTGDCNTALVGGGCLPNTLGASLTDPFGTMYGYCVWDHGAVDNGHADGAPAAPFRLSGDTDPTQPVIALISAGRDRTFQTSCLAYDGLGTDGVSRVVGSDDLVFTYTYAEASAASGGLWSIKPTDAGTAEIAKDLEVKDSANNVTVAIDRMTGVGDFLGITTNLVTAKTGSSIELDGNVGIGTSTPLAPLHINNTSPVLRLTTPTANSAQPIGVAFAETPSGQIQMMIRYDATGNNPNNRLHIRNQTGDDVLSILQQGWLGIGAPDPLSWLHLETGNSGFSAPGLTSLTTALIAARESRLQLYGADDAKHASSLVLSSGNNKHWHITHSGPNDANRLSLGYQSVSGDSLGKAEFLAVSTAGNVGIGTTNPQEKLHVVGKARITDEIVFTPNSNAAADKLSIKAAKSSPATNGDTMEFYSDYVFRFIESDDNLEMFRIEQPGMFRPVARSAAPASCNASRSGFLAMTSTARLCACNGSAWVEVNTVTPCAW